MDANLNDLTWWTEKHNGYATREMADMLMMEYGLDDRGKEVQAKFWGTEEQRKRWLKVKYIKHRYSYGHLSISIYATF